MKRAQLKNSQIAEELELPPVKVHCSILAEDAIKAAIADYKNEQGDVIKSAAENDRTLYLIYERREIKLLERCSCHDVREKNCDC